MKHFDHILLGGNIASLVAARDLSNAGKSVALVASPSSMGGHFSPINTLGHEFDLGMLLLELDSYFEQENDLSLYDPLTLNSAGKFAQPIADFLSDYFVLKEVSDTYVALDEGIIDDYYISNKLSGITQTFTDIERQHVRHELDICASQTPCHPRDKSTAAVFDTLSYEHASMNNHGATLHTKLIEPLVQKITNLASSELLARHHRLFWAPLYYPETLKDNIERGTSFRPVTFQHPIATCISSLSKRLHNDLLNLETCTLIPDLLSVSETAKGWLINGNCSTADLSSSLPQNVLAQQLGVESEPLSKSSFLIIFAKVQETLDFDVIFNAGTTEAFFRVVNQSRLRGDGAPSYLTVEYNLDRLDPEFISNEQYLREIESFFLRHHNQKITISDSSFLEVEKKVVMPTPGNVAAAATNTERLPIDTINLMGPSLGMHSGSLNDQLLQALSYARNQI